MPELEIVRPAKPFRYSFSTAPVYNALASLFLLMPDAEEPLNWLSKNTHSLTDEQLEVNWHVSRAAFSYLHGDTSSAFPDWIDAFAARDPQELIEHEARELIAFAGVYFPGNSSFPSPDTVLRDREAYLSLTRSIVEAQNGTFKEGFYSAEFERLQHPQQRQQTMVAHLRRVWANLLEEEWNQAEPLVRDSMEAFQSLSFDGLSRRETILEITGINRIPSHWDIWLSDVEELVFIPSVHIGNFLLLAEVHAGKAYILFPARIPKGAARKFQALSRTQLLARLRALADETRLLILDLIAHSGPKSAGDVMTEMKLSQSSASRHLSQLSTAGFLNIDKEGGVKVYSITTNAIEETFLRLQEYLEN